MKRIVFICLFMGFLFNAPSLYAQSLEEKNENTASEDRTTLVESKEVKKNEEVAESDSTDELRAAFINLRKSRDQLQAQFEEVKAKEKEYLSAVELKDQLLKDNQKLSKDNAELKKQVAVLEKQYQEILAQAEDLQKSMTLKSQQLTEAQSQLAVFIAEKEQREQYYVVKKADTLVKIAQSLCDNGKDDWRLIADLNRDQLMTADLIEVGMQLRLPKDCSNT